MKKVLLVPMSLIIVVLLSACTYYSGSPIEPNENNMLINIKNNTNFDFYGLEVHLLDHSLGIVNANGAKITSGEELRFEILKEDFKLDGNVEMDVFILTDKSIKDDTDKIPLNKKVILELGENKEIFFELTGESLTKAEINRKR